MHAYWCKKRKRYPDLNQQTMFSKLCWIRFNPLHICD